MRCTFELKAGVREKRRKQGWNESNAVEPKGIWSNYCKRVIAGKKQQLVLDSRSADQLRIGGSRKLAPEEKPPYKMADRDTPPKCFPPSSTGWSCGVRRPRWLQAAKCKETCKSSWECG